MLSVRSARMCCARDSRAARGAAAPRTNGLLRGDGDQERHGKPLDVRDALIAGAPAPPRRPCDMPALVLKNMQKSMAIGHAPRQQGASGQHSVHILACYECSAAPAAGRCQTLTVGASSYGLLTDEGTSTMSPDYWQMKAQPNLCMRVVAHHACRLPQLPGGEG